jgi:hypothetical protein
MAREFKSVQAQLEIYGGLFVQRLGDQLDANNTNASGALKGSIELTLKSDGRGFIIDALEYWGAVDEGTKPHKVPLSALMKWLSYPNVRDKWRFGESDKAFTELEYKTFAFLVQRKIARFGTEGTNFFTNVYKSGIVDDMVGAIADGTSEDYTAALDAIVDNFNRKR